MVQLIGGFSPKNAIKQFGSVVNPTGGVANYDVFTNVGDQRTPSSSDNSGAYEGALSYSDGRAWQYTNGSWQPYSQPADSSGETGENTGSYSGGSAAPSYSREDLAYLDSQQGLLDRQYGRTDTTLRDALDAVLQNYNKELSGANLTHGRNIEDFNDKTQVSEAGRSRELGKVDTSARMLADSLRQRIGLASGSGSSAYQVTAPRAVQRQASEQRGDVLQDYSANFMELDKNKRRSEEDFKSLLDELGKQKTQREGGVVSDVEQQRNSIRENQGRVAGERAKLLGGGYTGVRGAMAPFESQIQQGESLLDSIYSKYAAKYNVNPLQVRQSNLRDYATDNVAVRDQQATGSQDEYSPFKNFAQEDEEEKLV
jgi:hypothetical protein